MKKKFKQNRVKYVVGDNFGQPVMVEHIVCVEEVELSQFPVVTKNPHSTEVAFVVAEKQRGKRQCGQSQKSARDAKKQREKK